MTHKGDIGESSAATRLVQGVLQSDRGFAAAVTSTLVSQVLSLTLALAADVLIARALGPSARGVYALSILSVSLAVQLLDFGSATSCTYFIAREPGETAAVLGNLAVWAGGATCVAGLAAAVALRLRHGWLAGSIEPATAVWMVALVTLTMAYNYGSAVLYGQGSIAAANRMPVLHIAAFLGWCAASALWWRVTVEGVLAGAVAGRAVAAVYGMARVAWPSRCAPSLAVWRRCRRFAVREYGSNLTSLLAYRADQFLVMSLAGAGELGLYSVAASITERLNLFPGAIASVLMPKVAGAAGRRTVTAHSTRVLRGALLCSLAMAVAVGLFCPLAIRVLYGEAYSRAVAPVLLLLPGSLGLAGAKLASSHLLGQGRAGQVLTASALTAAVTLTLDALLIPGYGIAGAAAASSVGYCAAAAVQIRQLLGGRSAVRELEAA